MVVVFKVAKKISSPAAFALETKSRTLQGHDGFYVKAHDF